MSLLLPFRRPLLGASWCRNVLWRNARAVPSLDLDFATTKTLTDGISTQNLITFTRASSGTFVGSDGLIKTATTNLQRHSEDFTQGLTPNNATLTANQGIAPNGAITADQLLETTANGLHSQEIADHVFIAGAAYTFSCYAKSIGGRNFAPGFPTLFSSARFGFFNLSGSGSVVNTDAGVTASIQAVGDGWYRCSITSTCVTGGGARVGVFIASGTSISYVGDAAKGLLLWGAQLEQSSTVGEYIPTTSTINSAPRFDHNPTTGESLGLLVEEQRTNLLSDSENFASPWGLAAATRTADAGTAPNGTLTADRIESTGGGVFRSGAGVANATAYTYSVFLKHVSGTGVVSNVGFERFGATPLAAQSSINVQTGVIVSNGASVTASSITAYGNGWYRVTVTATSTDTTTTIINYASTSGNQFLIWGAQLEAGAFPTSYIPTTTATVTRSADVASITGANFSSWYNQTEGTVLYDGTVSQGLTNFPWFYNISDGTNNNSIGVYQFTNGIYGGVVTGGVAATPDPSVLFSPVSGSAAKHALAAKISDTRAAFNGSLSSAQTNTVMPSVNTLSIGQRVTGNRMNGTIRRLTYWPSRLPNATLQQITR